MHRKEYKKNKEINKKKPSKSTHNLNYTLSHFKEYLNYERFFRILNYLQGELEISKLDKEYLEKFFNRNIFYPYLNNHSIIVALDLTNKHINIIDSLLKGTFFLLDKKIIIRGMPKIFNIQSNIKYAREVKRSLLNALKESSIEFEEKIDGINFRVYKKENEVYFATRKRLLISTHHKEKNLEELIDPNPSIAPNENTYLRPNHKIIKENNLSNSRLLQAIKKFYSCININKIKENKVYVFEYINPNYNDLSIRYKKEKLYLTGIINEDFRFGSREELEKEAKILNVNTPKMYLSINKSIKEDKFDKLLKSYLYVAEDQGIEGYVLKARKKSNEDVIFGKIKTNYAKKYRKLYDKIEAIKNNIKTKEKDYQIEEEKKKIKEKLNTIEDLLQEIKNIYATPGKNKDIVYKELNELESIVEKELIFH